jgi:hypothetical protein
MRTAITAFMSVYIGALLNTHGAVHPNLESEVYAINQSAPHSAPVAFSIDYPKGWTKSENTAVGSDNLGDLATPRDQEIVCTFTSPLDPGPPSTPHTIRIVTNYASITIFRAYGATAKEEAQDLAARLSKMGDELQSLASVVTTAGDTGYLLMSGDDIPGGRRLRSEFIFHVGPRGHIRISIYVMGRFIGMRESLQNLVLESLRFPLANESMQPITR